MARIGFFSADTDSRKKPGKLNMELVAQNHLERNGAGNLPATFSEVPYSKEFLERVFSQDNAAVAEQGVSGPAR